MKRSPIEWCHYSLNPVIGCTPVSPGCLNCFARHGSPARVLRAGQWPGMQGRKVETWGARGERVRVKRFEAAMLSLERRPWICPECGHRSADPRDLGPTHPWRTPHGTLEECAGTHERIRVFVGDNCDLLDPAWPVEWLADTLDVIRRCPSVVTLLLTKRPGLWVDGMLKVEDHGRSKSAIHGLNHVGAFAEDWFKGFNPPRVLIGTSVEDQQRADERIPALLRIPAAGRFLSIEPLLGDVRLASASGLYFDGPHPGARFKDFIQWIIIGGESGPKARPCNVEWIRSLVRQGQAAGLATFVKQCGSRFHDWGEMMNRRILLKHPKGGDPAEWPEDLRVREFPEVLR